MEELTIEFIEEEIEDVIEEYLEDDYSSNCHCDTYGFCCGTSCPQYWQCQMPCK